MKELEVLNTIIEFREGFIQNEEWLNAINIIKQALVKLNEIEDICDTMSIEIKNEMVISCGVYMTDHEENNDESISDIIAKKINSIKTILGGETK